MLKYNLNQVNQKKKGGYGKVKSEIVSVGSKSVIGREQMEEDIKPEELEGAASQTP